MNHVLKNRDFRVLFLGRAFAVMALQAQAVNVGWYVYELSKDPLLLGLIGLTEAIPAIGFAFLAGHVVDSFRPCVIYRISVLVLLLNTLMICSTSWTSLPIDAHVRLVMLFSGVFVSGMVRSFTSPSLFTLVSGIVPRAQFSQAAAWNSWAFQMAAILGPALGGLLYGACGATVAFAIPPIFMFCASLSLRYFTDKARNLRSSGTREPFWTSVRAGIMFTYKQKVLLSAMALDMFSVLFGGATAILPMFSDQILHAGSLGLGFLRAAPSVGSGLVAMYLALKPLKTISGRMFLGVVAGFGLSIIGFALSTQFACAFLFMALSGAFDGVSLVIRSTVMQLLTPENMRGRVSSLSTIFITSSNEIGAFESGLAARLLGLIPSLIFGGIGTLVVVTTTAWASPELRDTRLKPEA